MTILTVRTDRLVGKGIVFQGRVALLSRLGTVSLVGMRLFVVLLQGAVAVALEDVVEGEGEEEGAQDVVVSSSTSLYELV